jgi:predicted RNase H-like nuclease (RuvC/YqgF family)
VICVPNWNRHNDFFILNTCIKVLSKMESEIDLLRQKNAKLVAKNYKLEAEIMKLRQIIEENARRDVRVKELEQKNKKLEARLTILEQSSLVVSEQSQNDKKQL